VNLCEKTIYGLSTYFLATLKSVTSINFILFMLTLRNAFITHKQSITFSKRTLQEFDPFLLHGSMATSDRGPKEKTPPKNQI